jgi:hypothetical protein
MSTHCATDGMPITSISMLLFQFWKMLAVWMRSRFSGSAPCVKRGLVCRLDHGSIYKARSAHRSQRHPKVSLKSWRQRVSNRLHKPAEVQASRVEALNRLAAERVKENTDFDTSKFELFMWPQMSVRKLRKGAKTQKKTVKICNAFRCRKCFRCFIHKQRAMEHFHSQRSQCNVPRAKDARACRALQRLLNTALADTSHGFSVSDMCHL